MNALDQQIRNAQQGGVRHPSAQAPSMPPQQQSSGSRGGFDFGGFDSFVNSQQRRGTPFENQMIKDAAGGIGGGLAGAMGQIGAGLNANADRMGERRQQGMNFTQSVGAVPFDLDPGGFRDWMDNNARYQNANFARQKQQAGEMNAMQRDNAQANMPMQQWQQNQKADMISRIWPMLMSGYGGGFGGMGGGLQTNFGASGTFG